MEISTNCQKAEVLTPAGQPLCEASVFFDPSDNILLMVPRDFDCQQFETFIVVFFDSVSGLIRSQCRLFAPMYVSDERQSVQCDVLEILEVDQRRQDLKLPLEMNLELSSVLIPPGAERPPASKIPAVTRNISAGGIYFVCDYALPVGALMKFQFLEARKPLWLTIKILRQDVIEEHKKTIYGYGCEFNGLKGHAEAELRSFIFRRERQVRQSRW